MSVSEKKTLVSCRADATGSDLQGKNPVMKDGKACTASREQPLLSVDQEEYYIPSVDLLTAQVPDVNQLISLLAKLV